jgi:hypothetical protein
LSAFFLLQSATTPELTNALGRRILTLSIQTDSVEYTKLVADLDLIGRLGADDGQRKR